MNSKSRKASGALYSCFDFESSRNSTILGAKESQRNASNHRFAIGSNGHRKEEEWAFL
jgi:hypothetical protein